MKTIAIYCIFIFFKIGLLCFLFLLIDCNAITCINNIFAKFTEIFNTGSFGISSLNNSTDFQEYQITLPARKNILCKRLSAHGRRSKFDGLFVPLLSIHSKTNHKY